MIDDLIAQLDALGEEEFYYFPATTKAKINEAKVALKSQAARIAELESGLQEAKSLLLQAHDTIFRLHENSDIDARDLITKIRLGFSGTAGGKDEYSRRER